MVKRTLDEDSDGSETPNKVARVAEDGESGWTVTRGPQIIEINGKSCQHEVAWPGIVKEETAFQPPARSKLPPAKQYPFSLDPFQQTAINCLEAGISSLASFSPLPPTCNIDFYSRSNRIAVNDAIDGGTVTWLQDTKLFWLTQVTQSW